VVPELAAMVENAEIERIGMEVAMKYEKMQGRCPEDVSEGNLGYDIRSTCENEVRYIEVKARAGEGEVALTTNEWFMAKRCGEQYWLYVVANAATKPVLYLINNPAEKINPQEKVEIVRFIVPVDEWKTKTGEIWKE